MHSLLIYVPEDLVIFNKDSDQHNFMINDLNMTFNVSNLDDPRIPFSGGIKNSGFGRELSGHGMLEFVNIKSVRFYDQLVHGAYVWSK